MSPNLYSKKVIKGMTDTELELACEARFSEFAPWVYWTSEIYSIGKCLRFWTKYPNFLPLFVYSDHGVGLETHLAKHALENRAKVHLTWNPIKEQRNKELVGRKVLLIMHPWIPYRHLRGIQRSKTTKGTLVFFSHSTSAVKWEGHDSEEYFEKLRELPAKFQPVVLCLHMHDIKAGLHLKIRRYGFPIVTAGNIKSINFVDRFYDLVKTYSYASSQVWGSQVAYCVELGTPFFFFGERPELINISDRNLPSGAVPKYCDKYHEEYDKKAEVLFRLPIDKVTDEQRTFVESLLGMDSKVTARQVSRILWHEFCCNWWKPHITLRPVLISFIHKLGLYSITNRIRQLFDSKLY